MKLTKFTVCFLLLATLFFIPSCNDAYDDSELTERVENLENKVQKLEERMNSNINSLQAILEAINNNYYITKVIPITNEGKEIGYTINFSKGNSINIYNGQDGEDGKNGQDGYTPQIGVKQDSDEIYYWTLDGEWMTDESGNKIKAQGSDGQDGQDGIKPKFKIENDHWFVSYNNGSTWEQLGKATGEDANNFFQSVTVKEADVEFILSDGSKFEIPLKSKIGISFSIKDEEVGISEGKTIYVDYILHNASERTVVTASSDGNFITKVIPNGINGGKISITSTNGATEGYINVIVNDGNEYTFINVINIFKNHIEFSGEMEYYIESKKRDIIIPFSINTSYTAKIAHGISWISIKPQSRADMHDETLNISVEKNTYNSKRTAKIQLCNSLDEEDIFAEINIIQEKYNPFDDAMILTALASSENDYTVYLPTITGKYITIDWGDGTQEHYETAGAFSHRYSVGESSDFDIKIIGDIKGLNSKDLDKNTITGIKQWGISKLESMEYAFYKQPLEFIANDEFGALENVTSFPYTFQYCSSLTSIPQGLFDKCSNVTSFNWTFGSCLSLTSIPQGLFDKCSNVTSFNCTFGSCSSLTSIPQGLFDKCTKVTNFESTFQYCSSLTSIPKGLFDRCTNVTDFESTFYDCSSLTSIPKGLFDKCTEVTNFGATFSGCSSLTSIPQGLFDYNRKVEDFAFTFACCNNIEGESPYTVINGVKYHLYEREKNPNLFAKPVFLHGCFRGCTKLTDYRNIPFHWRE